MTDRPLDLAIETSSRCGSISLGCDDRLLQSVELDQPQRHNIDLMPAIDEMIGRQGSVAGQLGAVYVSIGPGSFTGLRIAIATAKMLAIAGDVRVVAVPTIEVVARNAPRDVCHLAVCLSCKRDQIYAGQFRRDGDSVRAIGQARLMTMAQLLAESPRPLAIIGDPLPANDGPAHLDEDGVCHLPPPMAIPRSEQVWHLGRAAADRTTDPFDLLPLYAREPEAVALWNKRTSHK